MLWKPRQPVCPSPDLTEVPRGHRCFPCCVYEQGDPVQMFCFAGTVLASTALSPDPVATTCISESHPRHAGVVLALGSVNTDNKRSRTTVAGRCPSSEDSRCSTSTSDWKTPSSGKQQKHTDSRLSRSGALSSGWREDGGTGQQTRSPTAFP